MKVTLENYQELANSTMADLGSVKDNFAHMALGIASEFFELQKAGETRDEVNIIEEHGDLNWFVSGVCHIFDFNFKYLYNESVEDLTQDYFSTGEICTISKGLLAYGKEVDKDHLRKNLLFLLGYLKTIAAYEEFDYIQSLQKNIDKLRARFPNKFNCEDAINRAIDNERTILEN